MSLRVIGGRWGGRRIEAPPGDATRPLTDRIKQALFDWLGQDFSGATVVDCCAGSGAFGIEAASRGAAAVHCIEPGPTAAATIRTNLAALGNPPEIRLHAVPFASALPRLQGVDLVFADPPFPWYAREPDRLVELLRLAAACLAPGGALVIRGEEGELLPPLPPGLREDERRRYGRSWIALLRRSPAP